MTWEGALATWTRPLIDVLLQFEAAYAIPAIVLLVFYPDHTLLDAWNISRPGDGWWRIVELDQREHTIILIIALVAPFVPWLLHWLRSGQEAVITGAEAGLLCYLTGAQLGFTQSLSAAGAKARLVGILGAVFLYYTLYHTAPNVRSLRRWLWAILFATAAGAFWTLSLLGFNLPSSRSAGLLEPLLAALRPHAMGPVFHLYFFDVSQRLVVNPNGVADLAMVLAIAATAQALGSARRITQAAWCTIAGGALWLLLATGTRTALVGYAGGATLLIARSKRPWLAVLAPLVAMVALLTAMPQAKILQILDLWQSDAALARLQVWSGYWELVRTHPVMGTGLGLASVGQEYATYYGLNLFFTDPHAHNVLLQTYLEQTALGLAGLLLLLYVAGRAALAIPWRVANLPLAAQQPARLAVTSWAAGAGLLIHNLFDINLNTNAGTALLFALLAITIRGAQLARASASHPSDVADRPAASPTPPVSLVAAAPSARHAVWLTVALLAGVTILGHWPPPLAPHVYIR